MEIKSAPWQQLFARVVFGFIGFFSGAAALKACFAQQVTVIGGNGEAPSFLFWSGLGVLVFSVGCWWRTERYCLRTDAEGISQQTGFGTTRVKWQQVDSYRLEPLRGTREHTVEPVLYDRSGRVLLRPVAPVVVGMARQEKERAQFWRFVEQQLAGKKVKL